tara:strand:+ start:173 stop:511 length:339 start_codon:yes stop_codon:yes gene_type:complete
MKKWNELEYREKKVLVRFYKEDALNDDDDYIRLESYRILGYTKEALKDDDHNIRREAYQALGFTEDARNDADCDIRREAEIYLDFIANKKVTIEVTQHELDIINKIREDKKG